MAKEMQWQAFSTLEELGWFLSRQYMNSPAEIAIQAGVCTSSIWKAIQKMGARKFQVEEVE
jgi:hypothetical protein